MMNLSTLVFDQKSKLLCFLLALTLGACQSSDDSSGEVLVLGSIATDMSAAHEDTTDSEFELQEEQLELTIQALNPLSAQGVVGLEAELFIEEQSVAIPQVTDTNGEASFQLPPFTHYEVRLQGDDYSTHHLFGELGENNAQQISFVSNDGLTTQVFSALNISPNSNKGIVVIGLDRPNLSPAVGSKAELNGTYEVAFTLGSFGPSVGQEIISGGGGFVSFANVDPGMVEVIVESAPGELCQLFPRNESESFTIPVFAGEVSIVAYTCQAIDSSSKE